MSFLSSSSYSCDFDNETKSTCDPSKPLNYVGQQYVQTYTEHKMGFLQQQKTRVQHEAGMLMSNILELLKNVAASGTTSFVITLGKGVKPDYAGTIPLTQTEIAAPANNVSQEATRRGWTLFSLLPNFNVASSIARIRPTQNSVRYELPHMLHMVELKQKLESDAGVPNLIDWGRTLCVTWEKRMSHTKVWKSESEIREWTVKGSQIKSEHFYLAAQLEDAKDAWIDRIEEIHFTCNLHLYMLKQMGIVEPAKAKKNKQKKALVECVSVTQVDREPTEDDTINDLKNISIDEQ